MWKLVRDEIPSIIRAGGGKPKILVVSGSNLIRSLQDKLVEEAEELAQLGDNSLHSEYVEELADVLEVVEALKERLHITNEELNAAKLNKKYERGGFTKGFMLRLKKNKP